MSISALPWSGAPRQFFWLLCMSSEASSIQCPGCSVCPRQHQAWLRRAGTHQCCPAPVYQLDPPGAGGRAKEHRLSIGQTWDFLHLTVTAGKTPGLSGVWSWERASSRTSARERSQPGCLPIQGRGPGLGRLQWARKSRPGLFPHLQLLHSQSAPSGSAACCWWQGAEGGHDPSHVELRQP